MAVPEIPRVEQSSLFTYLEKVVGDCAVVSSTSVPRRDVVIEAVDQDGKRWFAKRLERRGQWLAEVRAYRRWVPALGDRALRLRGASARLLAFVVNAVPGRRGHDFDPVLHRGAGDLLRLFHEARPPRQAPDGFVDEMERRLNNWLSLSKDMFSTAEAEFARRQLRRVVELPPQPWVPCHGDYRPNNWLIDDAGTVRVIDFADSRWQFRGHDLTRLYFGPWWERPDLAAAFLDGYGQPLSDADREFICLYGPTAVIVTAVWGRLHSAAPVEERGRERLAQLMTGHSTRDLGMPQH